MIIPHDILNLVGFLFAKGETKKTVNVRSYFQGKIEQYAFWLESLVHKYGFQMYGISPCKPFPFLSYHYGCKSFTLLLLER